MKHPKIRNVYRNIKKSNIGLLNLPNITKMIKPRDLCRIIIDLKVKDNSYNDIIKFCESTLNMHVTKEIIMQIILNAGKRAKFLNGIYDELVQAGAEILVLDEVFQGHLNCFLGCADAKSHYLFMFQDLAHRSEEAIKTAIQEMDLDFEKVRLAITDGLQSYNHALPDAIEGVIHILCQVHAYRIILREQDVYHKQAEKAYTKVKDATDELLLQRTRIHKKQCMLGRRKKAWVKTQAKQAHYYQCYGIKPYSKKMTWTAKMLYFKARKNALRIEVKSQQTTVTNFKRKISGLQKALFGAMNSYLEKKQISLQTGRLVKRFHNLMKSEPNDFTQELPRFKEVLNRSKYPIAIKIRTFLNDHPELFRAKTKELFKLCPPSVSSTNIIEGIFGIFRPLLTKARHFRDNIIANAFFDLIRFHYNFSPPYTGPNKDKSPLQRAGITSKYEDYLDALYPEDRQNIILNGQSLIFESQANQKKNPNKSIIDVKLTCKV